jgi:hypothetical protein
MGGEDKRLSDVEVNVASLWVNVDQLHNRVRELEKMIDTKDTPLWLRIVFRLDGWSPWYHVDKKPRWRPWRKWWTS